MANASPDVSMEDKSNEENNNKGKASMVDEEGKTPMLADKGKAHMEEKKIEVRYGSTSLGSPNFTKLANHSISIKMERNNFLIWQNVALPILKSYKLENHLTGANIPEMSIDIPPCEDYPNGLLMANPEYDLWESADHLLRGWIYNCMSEEVSSQVLFCNTAKELWDQLQDFYGVQAKSQQDYNRQMLQQTRKGNLKMNEYLRLMKSFFDGLFLAGSPISVRDFISHILLGLDEEYTPIVVMIQSRTMKWNEVQSELLTFERRLDQLQALRSSISIGQSSLNHQPSANFAGHVNPRPNSQNNNQASQQRNYGNNRNQNRGRGRGRNQNSRPTCQLCGRIGHLATVCYYRYDRPGNDGATPPNPPPRINQPAAMTATAENLRDPAWYLDSGATNHLTAEIENLNMRNEFAGQAHGQGPDGRQT